jgi:PAS domain S-box-containing protein
MTASDPASPKILAVDDEPVIRENIASYLEDSGFEVLQASNGRQGLDMVHRHRPEVILLDLRMPEMDGLECLERIRRDATEIPVIVVSGTGVLQDAIEALRSGAQDFITKPILDMAVLEHAVRRAMERTRLLRENERYREHLEAEIEKRTADLTARSRELEASNSALQQEVAQRRKAEETLVQRERKFRELADLLPQVVFEVDPRGRFTFVNRYGAEVLGIEGGDGGEGGGQVRDLFLPGEAGRVAAEMARIARGEAAGSFDTPVRKADGTTFPAMVYLSPVRDAGTPAGLRGLLFDITELKKAEAALRASAARLEKENRGLKSSLRAAGRFGRIVGRSQAMQEVYDRILNAAAATANVIIYGESGTGKELAAQTIHELSDRRSGKFITVNCGAVPENLMESEFFGYRRGAFTGADRDKTGYLAEADGGTLFLDEIGEIPSSLQVKLLRAIDGGGYSPIGSSELVRPDLRIIAATNRDLKAEVRKGALREDFFYRIHIIPIHLPPLRRRREDIPLLINHFLNLLSDGRTLPAMPGDVVETLSRREWPGNIRELQNAVHRFITLKAVEPPEADPSEPPAPAGPSPESADPSPMPSDATLSDAVARFEKRYIRQLLETHRWHRTRVAGILGIDRRTLFRKIKEYGL